MRPFPTGALIVGTLALLLCACSGAADDGEIRISDARVPVPAGPNGAAYLSVRNDGASPDRLVAVSTDAAEAAELHESTTEAGSMAMRPVEAIDVPTGATVTLEPGGLHVMLVDGDTVEVTLTFERAGEQTVQADVVAIGDVQQPHATSHTSTTPAP